MRLFLASVLCAVISTPSVSRADTITIAGGGDVVIFSLPSMPNTYPLFFADGNGLSDPNFGLSGNFTVNINGIDFVTDQLLFGLNQVVIPDIVCPPPINIYDPCVFTVAFNNGSSNEIGNPPPLFSGTGSDPVLNLGTYTGSSGSGFPPPDTIETLTISSDTSPVPEPSSIVLMATGLLCLAGMWRRRQSSY